MSQERLIEKIYGRDDSKSLSYSQKEELWKSAIINGTKKEKKVLEEVNETTQEETYEIFGNNASENFAYLLSTRYPLALDYKKTLQVIMAIRANIRTFPKLATKALIK